MMDICVNLGNLYLTRQGITQDHQKAEELFKKACSSGLTLGYSNIGNVYYNGLGVLKDEQKVAKLLKQDCILWALWCVATLRFIRK